MIEIISTLTFLILIICYGVTFSTWMFVNQNLKPLTKWAILFLLMFSGSSKMIKYINNDGYIDAWIPFHIILCLLLMMILRGYNIYAYKEYNGSTKSVKGIFDGQPCRVNYTILKKINNNIESPRIFVLRLVTITASVIFMTVSLQGIKRQESIKNAEVYKGKNGNIEKIAEKLIEELNKTKGVPANDEKKINIIGDIIQDSYTTKRKEEQNNTKNEDTRD